MDANAVTLSTATLKRFDWIVRGEKIGPDPVCDVPIRSTDEALAIPTVGAVVPNWILIVPRRFAMSVADLAPSVRRAILTFGQDIGREMLDAGDSVFFEHGARSSGNSVGCGVDQAHLHVLATKIDLLGAALADQQVVWVEADVSDPWQGLSKLDYYFILASGKAFVGYPRASQSQYFRKLIARAAGVPSQWDYKVWPNYENVRRTYGRFVERGASTAKA